MTYHAIPFEPVAQRRAREAARWAMIAELPQDDEIQRGYTAPAALGPRPVDTQQPDPGRGSDFVPGDARTPRCEHGANDECFRCADEVWL